MKISPQYSVYIVECQDHTLYTGMARNVSQRIAQHNAGTGAKYTRARRPVILRYQEVVGSRSQALKREWAIKQLSRKQKLKLIQSQS